MAIKNSCGDQLYPAKSSSDPSVISLHLKNSDNINLSLLETEVDDGTGRMVKIPADYLDIHKKHMAEIALEQARIVDQQNKDALGVLQDNMK